MVHDGPAIGCENDMDQAIGRLKRDEVAIIVVASAQIAADGPGPILIGREGQLEGRAPGHAVVVDQKQPSPLELEEIDSGVGVGKR